jgi:hypothetical protein
MRSVFKGPDIWQTVSVKVLLNGPFGHFLAAMDPEQLKKFFLSAQILIGTLLLAGLWFLSRQSSESAFKVRESDLKKARAPLPGSKPDQTLAHATLKRAPEPLRLGGIRIDGAPHEILGVTAQATEAEIQAAYRELMKQYHPDRVGRPGTREWADAQKIAEAINTARTRMLARAQSHNPNRSGR